MQIHLVAMQYRPNNGNGTPRARYPAANNRGPNAGQFTYPSRPALYSNKLRNAQCEMMYENNFDDAMFYGDDDDVSDDCQDSEAYQSGIDDKSNVDVNVADNDFIIRVNVNGLMTEAIRDTGNLGPVLVCKELVPDSAVRYNKCVYLTGAFDGCKKRKFPTAKISIKSESFGVDQAVDTIAAIAPLPPGVNCIIGNEFFKRNKQLTDIVLVRNSADVRTPEQVTSQITEQIESVYSEPDSKELVNERETANHVEVIQEQSGHTERSNELTNVTVIRKPLQRTEIDNSQLIHVTDTDQRHIAARPSDLIDVRTERHDTQTAVTRTTLADQSLRPTNTLSDSPNARSSEPDIRSDGTGAELDVLAVRTRQTAYKRDDCVHYDDDSESATVHAQADSDLRPNGDQITGDNRHETAADVPADCTATNDKRSESEAKTVTEFGNIDMSDIKNYADQQAMNSDEFKDEQRKDKTLQSYWIRASGQSNEFKIFNERLYRRAPVSVNSTDDYQLVVPRRYQSDLLKIAHDKPTSGHLGIKKTKERLQTYFWWPGMEKMVACYVKKNRVCMIA